MVNIKRLLKSEAFWFVLIATFVLGTIFGGINLWTRHEARVARQQAQALVGTHEVINGRWYWVGYVELDLADGQIIQVPVNTEYGSRFASYCWNVRHATRFRVRVSYHDQPENTWADSSAKTWMPGAYLSFTELDSDTASAKPPDDNQ